MTTNHSLLIVSLLALRPGAPLAVTGKTGNQPRHLEVTGQPEAQEQTAPTRPAIHAIPSAPRRPLTNDHIA